MKSPKHLFGALLLIALVVACTQSQPSGNENAEKAKTTATSSRQSSGEVAVSIKNFKFVPSDIVVISGTTVIWTNEDIAPHTVESSDGTLKSDELSKGDAYKFTFSKAGTYNYNCGIHSSMHGSVTVQ